MDAMLLRPDCLTEAIDRIVSEFNPLRIILYHYPRQVCYLAQQTIEKALKAALILEQIVFPFSHDLDRLRIMLPAGWQVKDV